MDNVDIDVHGYEAAPKIITGDLLKALRVDETEVEDSDVDDPYNPANESTVLNRLPDEVFAAIAKFMDPTSYFNTKAICQVLKWKCERVERDLIFPIHSVILKKDGALEVICVEAKDEKIYDKLPGTRFGLTIDSFNCESGPLDDKLLDKVEALLHRRRVTIDALTTLKITCSLEKFKTFTQKHAIKRFRLGGEVPETFLDFMQDKIACMCGEDDFSQKLPGGMDYFLKSPITCGDFTFPPQKPFTVDNCRQLIEALNAGRILGHIFFSVHNISNYDDIFTGMVTLNFDKDRDYGKELAEITTRPLVFRSSVDFVSVVATEGDKMYLLDGEFDNKFFVLLSYNVDDIQNFYGFDQDYADTELNENEDQDEDDEEYEDAEDSEND